MKVGDKVWVLHFTSGQSDDRLNLTTSQVELSYVRENRVSWEGYPYENPYRDADEVYQTELEAWMAIADKVGEVVNERDAKLEKTRNELQTLLDEAEKQQEYVRYKIEKADR